MLKKKKHFLESSIFSKHSIFKRQHAPIVAHTLMQTCNVLPAASDGESPLRQRYGDQRPQLQTPGEGRTGGATDALAPSSDRYNYY